MESVHPPAVPCPPHHWLIGNELTSEGTIERWSCQRCGTIRERLIARRRATLSSERRYVGEDGDVVGVYLGYGGERVA